MTTSTRYTSILCLLLLLCLGCYWTRVRPMRAAPQRTPDDAVSATSLPGTYVGWECFSGDTFLALRLLPGGEATVVLYDEYLDVEALWSSRTRWALRNGRITIEGCEATFGFALYGECIPDIRRRSSGIPVCRGFRLSHDETHPGAGGGERFVVLRREIADESQRRVAGKLQMVTTD